MADPTRRQVGCLVILRAMRMVPRWNDGDSRFEVGANRVAGTERQANLYRRPTVARQPFTLCMPRRPRTRPNPIDMAASTI